jgi:IPT/TIG domain
MSRSSVLPLVVVLLLLSSATAAVAANPQVSIDDVSVYEGTAYPPQPSVKTYVSFTIFATSPAPYGDSIPITAHDGSAKKGVDYVAPPSYVSWPKGASTIHFDVEIIQNRNPQGDRTFSIEIGQPPYPSWSVGKSIGVATILDDDDAVSPTLLHVPIGGKGIIQVQVTDSTPFLRTGTVQTFNSFLSAPSSFTIPPGQPSAEIEVGALDAGTGDVFVTLPPSLGGRTYDVSVIAYPGVALSIDPRDLVVPLGGTANLTVKLDPPPSSPVTVKITQTTPSVAQIPSSIVVDATGTASIPLRATALGTTFITVTLPDANGGLSKTFNVAVTAPTGVVITGLSQPSGRTSGGETVKVAGVNFNAPCAVTFGGVPAQASEPPANGAISATTPPHAAGAVDVGVRCGASSYTFTNGFTYNSVPLLVSAPSPPSGSTHGGTIVVLRGSNFPIGACSASFGGAVARAFAWNGTTSMTVATPAHAAGSVPVTVTCGSNVVTIVNGFTYLDGEDVQPSISSLSAVRAAPGDRLTLTGQRFRLDDAIVFGATVVRDDVPQTGSDTHVVIVPELAPGSVSTFVRDVVGRITAGPTIEITAPPAPAINQIDARLTIGGEFAVSGTGFRRALTFALGPAILQPVSISATKAIFRVPPSVAAGPASFTISDRGTTLASRPVDVGTSGLAVTAVSAPCSLREGDGLVTISGSGFDRAAMVQFGSAYSAAVAWQDAFKLTAKVPPAFGATDVTIAVVNPDGTTSTLTGAFTYRSAAEGGCTPRRHTVGH